MPNSAITVILWQCRSCGPLPYSVDSHLLIITIEQYHPVNYSPINNQEYNKNNNNN